MRTAASALNCALHWTGICQWRDVAEQV